MHRVAVPADVLPQAPGCSIDLHLTLILPRAACLQAWWEYELADARLEGGGGEAVIDGARPEEAQRMGRRLAAIAGNEVLQVGAAWVCG